MPERTNGKTIKVNVNQLVYKELHRPKVDDLGKSFPIYTKVDSYKRNREDTLAESSHKYIAKSKTHYNSANNIRKLYITHNTLYIEYYKSPGIANAKLTSGVQVKLDTDILSVLPDILEYRNKLVAYQMERNIDPKVKGPDNYILEGNLIGVVNQLYTCSNIEEIYFDWSFLFTQDIQTALASCGLEMFTGEGALRQFLSSSVNGGIVKNDIWKKWFMQTAFYDSEKLKLAKSSQYFRDKYPRLKIIAMVSNLDNILLQSVRGNSLINELKNGGEQPWLMKNADLISSSGSTVIVSMFEGIPLINSKFVTQEDVYLFDTEFKQSWIKLYTSSIEDYIRRKRYGQEQDASTEEDSNIAINEVEQKLLDIEQELGSEKFNEILKATALSGFKMGDLKSLFRSFTKANRVKWAKTINLSLE